MAVVARAQRDERMLLDAIDEVASMIDREVAGAPR